jgi:NAD(P)-dependent dehydrogenase (short-subunit alcohol dehydrogenase family)
MNSKKVILITGASRGIGAATAIKAAERGYRVCVNYVRNEKAAAEVVEKIVQSGGEAIAIKANVADEKEVDAMFLKVYAKFGRLDALVNNAAVLEPQTVLSGIDVERLTRVFAVNVFGTIICSKEAVRMMAKSYGGAGGAIVNISSVASKHGSPFEYLDYAASKGAVDTFTLGLAKELASEGIRVNCVRPGVTYTDIHASGGEPGRVDRVKDNIPLQRGGLPDEIANAILWLISDEASYTSGAILDVAGGK